ncbi:response regulator receiver protein [Paraburkholderia sediminicola]|uniref:response regulator receiver protein n=1 Tax=Paraburkholderia sediminicola TaxID=458836 RepID=UPI0038BA4B51
MARRPPLNDEREFALWNRKRAVSGVDASSVVVAHLEEHIGEALALLLGLGGFVTAYAADMETVEMMLEHWRPSALLIDTRLCRSSDFRYVRKAASNPAFRSVLLIAMTDALPDILPAQLRVLGFDGLCRRPCPLWLLADMLDRHSWPEADTF